MKKCIKCKQEKPKTEFYTNNADGLKTICKTCYNRINNEKRKAKKEFDLI